MPMRTYSTPQSALDGEITKLAILECVVSVALYLGVGVYLGTFKYLAWAVVVAPLMLFRTDFSADWGLRLYVKYLDRVEHTLPEKRAEYTRLDWVYFLIGLIGVVLTPLVGNAIRIVATVYWVIRKPLQTLKAIPQNWLRQCFCTDFAHPPEVVPKEATADHAEVVTFAEAFDEVRSGRGRDWTSLLIIFPFVSLGWLPSMIYRISFKATALAYVPLVWVAQATLQNPLPLKARLERITKGELEKVRRWLSGLILTTLVAKLALVFSWVDRGYVESKFPSQKVVTSFVVLDAWPWWQIALAVDALLTFALLFFADAALARIEGQIPWREERVMTTVAAVSFFRAALAVVTISHFFYIALLAAAPDSVRHLLVF
jgi:hypothetical protein